jgi:hypothetical protein
LQGSDEQAGVMNTLKLGFMPMLVDSGYLLGIGQIDPHHRRIVLDVQSEIVKRVGMPPFDDGIGF